jgi:hypothetical protein
VRSGSPEASNWVCLELGRPSRRQVERVLDALK